MYFGIYLLLSDTTSCIKAHKCSPRGHVAHVLSHELVSPISNQFTKRISMYCSRGYGVIGTML